MNEVQINTKNNDANNKPFWFIIGMIFLLPIFFLSENILSLYTTKSFIFLTLTLISLLIFIIFNLRNEKIYIPNNLFSLSVLAITLVYFLSAISSNNFGVSFWGNGFEFTSVFFNFMLFILLCLSTNLFFKSEKVLKLYIAIFVSFAVFIFIHLFNALIPSLFPDLGFFFQNTSNTLGRWFDVGVISGLVILFLVLILEFLDFNKTQKIFLNSFLGLSFLLTVLVGFKTIWIILMILSAFIFTYKLSLDKKNINFKLPLISLITFIASFIFLFGANIITDNLQRVLNINNFDVRLDVSTTMELNKDALMKKPILGYGPIEFNIAWSQLKNTDINVTEFWNNEFYFGFGYFLGIPVTLGILGLLAWLFFFGLFIYYGLKSLFRKTEDLIHKFIKISSYLLALYAWIISFVYVPNLYILVFGFLMTGVFVATLYKDKILNLKEINLSNSPKFSFIYVLIAIILILLVIMTMFKIVEKTFADNNYQKYAIELNRGNLNSAENHIINSINFNSNSFYRTEYSNFLNLRINNLLNNDQISDEEKSEIFSFLLQSSIGQMLAVIDSNKEYYRGYLLLGDIFRSMIAFEIEGSYDEAKRNYEIALEKNPNNPNIYLSLAQLEIANNNIGEAKKFALKAIELKPNYIDAIFTFAQIQVLEGDVTEAIQSAEFARSIRPNDPFVHFRLGLLLYQNNETERAVTSFERTIALNPSFLNAKYFLGLSYERLNRINEAITQFEQLNSVVPENEEVSFILNNLRVGRPSFENIQPPFDVDPKERESLPIEEEVEDVEEAE